MLYKILKIYILRYEWIATMQSTLWGHATIILTGFSAVLTASIPNINIMRILTNLLDYQ